MRLVTLAIRADLLEQVAIFVGVEKSHNMKPCPLAGQLFPGRKYLPDRLT